jgi:hypothetical protein
MWRTFLTSLGIFTIVLAGCDPEVLIAKPSADSYEVVAVVAD